MPELPINILVIVAIAVIILLSIVALYFTGWSPFGGFVSLASLKNTGCSNFSFNYACGARGASTSDIKFQTNSYKVNNLFELCENYLNASTESECRASCGCGATISGGGGCVCNWDQQAPPVFCTVVGVGNGCMEDCNCAPGGCGGQCTGTDVYCVVGIAPQWPEGTSGCCVIGAVGC